jgi:ketosteroid isomerase-like protein
MAQVTPEMVIQAYEALASGDREKIRKYWADDMIWLVPGHNPISGWKRSLDEFLRFMQEVGRLSGNSFRMNREAIMTSDDASADVTRNVGNRAEDENRKLDIK